MRIIGIVGGVASGKSRVAQQFAELGAVWINADQLGHEVLQDPQVKRELIDRWGAEVVDDSGELNRTAIGRRVFGNSEAAQKERQFLESVTHPRIASLVDQRIHAARSTGSPMVVLDAALLLEANWAVRCDHLVFVDVPEATRRTRARDRGWTDEQFASREAAQWPLKDKRHQADSIIDNSRSLEETFQQVQDLWSKLVPADASATASTGVDPPTD